MRFFRGVVLALVPSLALWAAGIMAVYTLFGHSDRLSGAVAELGRLSNRLF